MGYATKWTLRAGLLFATMAVPSSAQAELIAIGGAKPEECASRPVGAMFRGRAYIAYPGTDSNNRPNVLASDDLITYRKRTFDSEQVETSGGVALTVFGDRLYLLFTAVDKHLVFLSSRDGETWPDKVVLPHDFTEHQPDVAVHDGQLVVSYRNLQGGLNLLATPTPLDVDSYVRHANVGGSTGHGTSVASFGGRLVNAYTGQDDALNLQDLGGFGATLRANYVSADTSDDGWWVTPWNGSLYGTWRGSGNEALNIGSFSPDDLNAAFSASGTWVPNTHTLNDPLSELGPSLAAFGRTLALLWQGTDDKVNILRYATAPPSPPHVCAFWPVAFVDSGFGESGLPGIGPQLAPARFAKYAVKEGARIVQEGFLDANGCVTVAEIPTETTNWLLELTSLLQRGEGRVDVRGIQPEFKGPSIADKLKLPNSNNLLVKTPLRLGLDPEISAIFTLVEPDQEDVARIAAVAGQLLTTTVPLRGTAFALNDGCQVYYPDSCASGNQLFIGPAPNHPNSVPQSQEKFVVAHELGHVFEVLGGANANHEGYPQLGITEPLCECHHVTVANQYHCLQSLETAGDGRVEGFAQYIAARTFNSVSDANPTFVYYKEFLWPACPTNARCEPFEGLFRQKPPIPLSASRAALWRNRTCPGVPEFATEFDWMNFFWNVSLPGPLEVTIEQLYQISAAQPGIAIASNDAYLGLAREVVGADVAERFWDLGRTYGVSSDTSER